MAGGRGHLLECYSNNTNTRIKIAAVLSRKESQKGVGRAGGAGKSHGFTRRRPQNGARGYTIYTPYFIDFRMDIDPGLLAEKRPFGQRSIRTRMPEKWSPQLLETAI